MAIPSPLANAQIGSLLPRLTPITQSKSEYNLNQIIAALQTNLDGYEGQTLWWRDSTIEYSIPVTSPDHSSDESVGFGVSAGLSHSTVQYFRGMAFELWDDLIAYDLNPNNANANAQITLAFSSTTDGGRTYTHKGVVGQPPGSSTFERDYEYTRIWYNSNSTRNDSNLDFSWSPSDKGGWG